MASRVSTFWAGAASVSERVCLVALAKQVGGWEALPAALVRGEATCGLSSAQRRRWLAAEGYTTRGEPVCLRDAAYPSRLLATTRPPAMLHIEGDLSCVERPVVGVVGSRNASLHGLSQAWFLAWAFASAGWTVASGLARGVDSAAHRGAMTRGATVAVLGHGLSHMYPRVNHGLRAEINASGGAVLTAFADDVRPAKWTFPRRNRWIAGLADLVVVVEAGERSGALWTARHAASMHREVVVISQNGNLSAGCEALAERGAAVVCDVWAWCVTRLGSPAGAVPNWCRDLLIGATVEEVARTHNIPVRSLCQALGRLCASGEVEALSHGRYAPKGTLSEVEVLGPCPPSEDAHG